MNYKLFEFWESFDIFLKWWKKTAGGCFSAVYWALSIPLVCRGIPGFKSFSVDDVTEALSPLALTMQL